MPELTVSAEALAAQIAREERRMLDGVVASLAKVFPSASPASIERVVDTHYLTFYNAPIREYIPLLVEHEAREELRARGERMVLRGRQRVAAITVPDLDPHRVLIARAIHRDARHLRSMHPQHI